MFCHECGQRLIEGAKFCSACGTKVVAAGGPAPAPMSAVAPTVAATAAPAAPAADSDPFGAVDRTVDVLQVQDRSRGLIGSTVLLLFTGAGDVLIVPYDQRKANDFIRRAQAQAKADGKGWFARVGANFQALYAFSQSYLQKTPAEIRADAPTAKHLPNASINGVTMHYVSATDEQGSRTVVTFYIDTAAGRHRLELPDGNNIRLRREWLERTFGARFAFKGPRLSGDY